MHRIHDINPDHPQPDIIKTAADVIRDNGVVIVPTRGLYGLGGNALNASVVKRIISIKSRSSEKPLLALISRPAMLANIVFDISPMASYLMDAFWPGKMTLVMEGRKGLPDGLCSGTGRVGVRWVEHPVAVALVDAVGRPITGTSANLSGLAGCADIGAIDNKVTASVDMVLNAGPLVGGPGSTVVDVTGKTPDILREGAVKASEVMDVFRQFCRHTC
jgi:L-threonylcarbamoyladenylate synthase